jgi:hypothetical protein
MKQLTVITRNVPGQLADITAALADAGINIEDIEADGATETGVISLTVDRYHLAMEVLSEAGFQAVTDDALIVRLADKPGALAEIALRFKDAGLNLHSMHIIQREAGHSLASIVTDDNSKAAALVRDVLVG